MSCLLCYQELSSLAAQASDRLSSSDQKRTLTGVSWKIGPPVVSHSNGLLVLKLVDDGLLRVDISTEEILESPLKVGKI